MSTNEVSVNIHHYGLAIDEHKRKVKCNYCGKVVSGFSRLKCHVAGIRGDVTPCEAVPPDLKELMRNELLEKKKGHLSKEVGQLFHPDLSWKRDCCHQSNDVEIGDMDVIQNANSGKQKRTKVHASSDNDKMKSISSPKGSTCSQAAGKAIEVSSLEQAQKCIARFFYEMGIDFSTANSYSVQKMINSILGCGQMACNLIPSCAELKGRILRDEVKQMQHYVNEIRNSWASTGCSILLDGWIDEKGRNLINILVDCPQGPIYLRSADISATVGNAAALELFLDEVIGDVGVDNVVQIVTYSASGGMEAVGKQLMEKYRTFFWTVSASHCIELMLEKMEKMDPINGILNGAKTITKFIYSRAAVLKLMRNHTCGCDLVKPSRIKSVMCFLTLENIVTEKENLKKMFISSEWSTSVWASSREGKLVADMVADHSFWAGALVVLKAAIPLVHVLQLINEDDKPQLGYIYETMDQAKETIKEEFNEKKSQYMQFWSVIDEIWDNHLHSPLHSAGYFLNPSLFYSSDFFSDAEVASGLLCCIVRMVKSQHVQDVVSLQLDEYRAAKGAFGRGSSSDRRSNISPAAWWSSYGGHCSELQRLAIRILSQTCTGASKYQLKRTLAEKMLSSGRNCIEQCRLADLTFVHYNLHLQNCKPGVRSNIVAEEIDPTDDWIVDEAQASVLQNEETTWMDLDCGEICTEGVVVANLHTKEESSLPMSLEGYDREKE